VKILQLHIHPQILLIVVSEFLLAGGSFYLSAYLITAGDLVAARASEGLLFPRALLFACLVVTGISAMGLYSVQQRLRIEEIWARVFVGLALAGVLVALLDFFISFVQGRALWVSAFAVSLVLLSGARVFFKGALDDELFRRRILVYGEGKRAASLLELRRQSDQRGFIIAAFIPAPGDKMLLDDDRVAASNPSLLTHARQARATEIIIAMDDRRRGFPVRELLECKLSGLRVTDLLEFLERETGRVKVDLVNPGWIIFSERFATTARRRLLSRLFDLVGSISLFVVTLPLMLITSIAIVIGDGWPIFVRQERTGFLGKPFTLYKFRSMRQDAEADGKARWAQENDARVTRVGRVIRRFRFDELPQLFNVIRGDMSFVGPRPERPEFVKHLNEEIPYYHERHYVKPGLTGWAQLRYPYGASEKDALAKLQYDMYYVKNRSLIFDLMILVQTAEVIFWRKGSR